MPTYLQREHLFSGDWLSESLQNQRQKLDHDIDSYDQHKFLAADQGENTKALSTTRRVSKQSSIET